MMHSGVNFHRTYDGDFKEKSYLSYSFATSSKIYLFKLSKQKFGAFAINKIFHL